MIFKVHGDLQDQGHHAKNLRLSIVIRRWSYLSSSTTTLEKQHATISDLQRLLRRSSWNTLRWICSTATHWYLLFFVKSKSQLKCRVGQWYFGNLCQWLKMMRKYGTHSSAQLFRSPWVHWIRIKQATSMARFEKNRYRQSKLLQRIQTAFNKAVLVWAWQER